MNLKGCFKKELTIFIICLKISVLGSIIEYLLYFRREKIEKNKMGRGG